MIEFSIISSKAATNFLSVKISLKAQKISESFQSAKKLPETYPLRQPKKRIYKKQCDSLR